MRALLRLAAFRFVDLRDPIQIAYARIATRAMSIAPPEWACLQRI